MSNVDRMSNQGNLLPLSRARETNSEDMCTLHTLKLPQQVKIAKSGLKLPLPLQNYKLEKQPTHVYTH